MIDKGFHAFVQECTEQELFLLIYNLGGAIWAINHDLADGRYESTEGISEWLTEAQAKIECAVDGTQRFGVSQPRVDPQSGATTEYWNWYEKMKSWWDGLSEEAQLVVVASVDFPNGGNDGED